MSEIYQRGAGKGKFRDLRRVLFATLLVLAASAAWFLLRPAVIRRAARMSIGGPNRPRLVRAAIQQVRGKLPSGFLAETVSPTYSQPAPGGFTWRESVTDENGTVTSSRFVIADHRFREVGSVRAKQIAWQRIGDFNGDGKPDVLWVNWDPTPRLPGGFVQTSMVIHTRGDQNEISGILLLDWNRITTPARSAGSVFLDTDNDGVQELVVRSYSFAPPPKGKSAITAAIDVAVFEWAAPDGVLRARHMPNDGTVAFWAPPDGRPYSFPADRSIDDVLKELIPDPASLFPPPVTQPASEPASAPAANPDADQP